VLEELGEIGWLPRELRRLDRPAAEPVVPGRRGEACSGSCGRDLRFGARTMLKQSLVSAIAVLALALGIGGNTAIFSMVNAILLRQLRSVTRIAWCRSPCAVPTPAGSRSTSRITSTIAIRTGAWKTRRLRQLEREPERQRRS